MALLARLKLLVVIFALLNPVPFLLNQYFLYEFGADIPGLYDEFSLDLNGLKQFNSEKQLEFFAIFECFRNFEL